MNKFLIMFFIAFVCMALPVNAERCTMVRASHILVKTEAEADRIENYLQRGADFATMAKMYSLCPSGKSGGDLNFFSRGQMVKPFEEKAFSMKKNEISEPVKTEFGWHIIKVTDKICEF